MSVYMILAGIAIATLIILLLITKVHLNPTVALTIGASFLGIFCRIGFAETASIIGTGFGNTMISLGLPIGFGCILGELLSRCGGCRVIAQTMIRAVGPKYVVYAIAAAGFVLSIPVFFDVAFIILVPLCIEIAKELDRPLPTTIVPCIVGAHMAHYMVPPTPNPLIAPDYFPDLSMGVMVGGGLIFGALMTYVTVTVFLWMMDHNWWDDATCKKGEAKKVLAELPSTVPSFGMAMIPIIVPVVLLVVSSFADALGYQNAVLTFLSNKNIALMIGALLAYWVASVNMDYKEREAAANKSLEDAGIVMLITGAGGAFSEVISATGMADALAEVLSVNNIASPLVLIFIVYAIGFLLRVSLGSGTVACLSAMAIMRDLMAATGVHVYGLWAAIATFAAGMSFPHINDSGFWVVANMSGFTVKGTFKTYSTSAALMSIQMLLIAVVGTLLYNPLP